MREDDIKAQLVSELDAATASDVDVRTVGDDKEIPPPQIVIDFSSQRMDGEVGHTNLGGFTTDNAGNKTGYVFHEYYLATADILARSYDEQGAHDLLDTAGEHFSPYEYQSDWFHADTREWRVGDVGPRENPVIEPNWYQFGIPVRFQYVRETTKSSDTLTSVDTTITEDSDTLDSGDKIIG